MSRIPPLDRADFSPELQAATAHIPDDSLGSLRVFGHAPELALAWLHLVEAVYRTGLLPPRTVELVRLRVASHNQCPRCMSLRLDPEEIDEETVCHLDSMPVDSLEGLNDAERAAVRFGELLATDHHQIDDEMFVELAEHYSAAEITELVLKVGTFVGFGRLGAAIRLIDDLPEQYAKVGRLTFKGS